MVDVSSDGDGGSDAVVQAAATIPKQTIAIAVLLLNGATCLMVGHH